MAGRLITHGSRRLCVIVVLVVMVSLVPLDFRSSAAPDTRGVPPGVAIVHGDAGNSVSLGATATPFAVLTDLTAYLARDLTMPLPAESQVTAPVVSTSAEATFDLSLPIQPQGTAHRFGTTGDAATQIFAVSVQSALGGTPFVDPFEFSGWPTGYASVRLTPGTFEIEGGSLLVWTDRRGQQFPSGMGPDGRIFTDDDPQTALTPGWTLVSLDTEPFARSRELTVNVPIAAGFAGPRDLSGASWVDAFDRLTADLRAGYPFTDSKGVDWDHLVATYRPQVVEAETANDVNAFDDVLLHFSAALGDGHAGATPLLPALRSTIGASAGFTVGMTDFGAVAVTSIDPGGPAAVAGLTVGTVITAIDGRDPRAAIAAIEPIRSVSTPAARTDEQLDLLPLGPAGSHLTIEFRTPGESQEWTATLVRSADDGAVLAFLQRDRVSQDERIEPPVSATMLNASTAYVRVATFAESPDLIISGWTYAITHAQQAGARHLILDLRGNPGGIVSVATYLAGTFITQPVNLADLTIRAPDGSWPMSGKLIVRPHDALWSGGVSVLVDSGCLSACEILAGALAANPSYAIVGSEPTGGTVATVFFWELPGQLVFQAPLGRYERNGTTWLEGTGVVPTVHVPVTMATLTQPGDPVLAAAMAEAGAT